MLGLSQAQVRSCVKAGFASPQAGAGGELVFSFQDLVLLRTAKQLLAARVPRRRIRMALDALQVQLPHGQPLTAVRISAQGHRVVARDRGEVWYPESGQTLLDFEVADMGGTAAALAPAVVPAPRPLEERRVAGSAPDWYEEGVALEQAHPQAAMDAYRHALDLDTTLADAHLNLGRLLHGAGDLPAAESHYRDALTHRPGDSLAAYNLGVALQDQRRLAEAVTAYNLALASDPDLADAHFNLSGLYEELGDGTAAFRHLRTYHKLTSGDRR